MQLEHRIRERICEWQRGPDGPNQDTLRLSSEQIESADKNVVARLHESPGRYVGQAWRFAGIEIVNVYERDAGGIPGASHNCREGTGIQSRQNRRFLVACRS